jgi:type 1 fimbria pilin
MMNNRLLLPLSCFILALSLFSPKVDAGSLKCATEVKGAFPLIAFTGSNGIKLSSSLPVGRTVFNQNYVVNVWCSISDPLQQGAEMAFFTRTTTQKTLGNGLTLFTTLNGNRDSERSVVSTGVMIDNHNAAAHKPSRTWQRFPLNVTVEIVKTAKTPEHPEQVTPINSRVQLFHVGGESGTRNAKYMMLDAATGLTFIAQSCHIQGPSSFNVALGPVRLRQQKELGSGIGSTSAGKTFLMDFLCDTAVSGEFSVFLQLSGVAPAGRATPGLIALSNDSNRATGVALQILHAASGSAVDIGQRWPVARYPLSGSAISVPLRVRYYQTEERITAGKANGTMTWVLSYF